MSDAKATTKSSKSIENKDPGGIANITDAAFDAASKLFGQTPTEEETTDKSLDDKVKEKLDALSEAKNNLSKVVNTAKDELDAGAKELSKSIDNTVNGLYRQIREELKIKDAEIARLKGIINTVGDSASALMPVLQEAKDKVDNLSGAEDADAAADAAADADADDADDAADADDADADADDADDDDGDDEKELHSDDDYKFLRIFICPSGQENHEKSKF